MTDVEDVIGDGMLESIMVGECFIVIYEVVGSSFLLNVECTHPVEHNCSLMQTLKEEFEGHSWLYIKSDV